VRVDSGVFTGTEVTLYYDPMIAKISATGPTRDAARRRLIEALRETVVLGPTTNLEHLLAVLEHPAFAAGEVHTGFLPQHLRDWKPAHTRPQAVDDALWCSAAVLLRGAGVPSALRSGVSGPEPLWSTLGPDLDGRGGAS
jgi:acetyl/propionyl-CoA carboxylase alpha subunit